MSFDTGNDVLNGRLDELQRWAECPRREFGADEIEVICEVLEAAEREPKHHESGGCEHCAPRFSCVHCGFSRVDNLGDICASCSTDLADAARKDHHR